MSKFLYVQISLLILFVISLYASAYSGPSVISIDVARGEIDSAAVEKQQFKITFSRPMDKKSVEASLVIEPAIRGTVSWAQNTMFFTALDALQYDTSYQITISPSAVDKYGKFLHQEKNFTIKTEPASLLYLGQDEQLYRTDLEHNTSQLTSGFSIIDYFVDRASQQIILHHYDDQATLPRFSLLDIETGKIESILDEFVGQMYFVNFDENSSTLYFNFDNKQQDDFRRYIHAFNILSKEHTLIDTENTYLFAFWPLKDTQTLLLQDLESRFILYDRNTKASELIGTFTEFIDVSNDGGTLFFRQNDTFSQLVTIGIENRQLTPDDVIAALPDVDAGGNYLAYSYKQKPIVYDMVEPNFSLRIVLINNLNVISDLSDPELSYERPMFSPNSRYIAITTVTREKGKASGYIMPSLRQQIIRPDSSQRVKIFDLMDNTLTDFEITGYKVRWL